MAGFGEKKFIYGPTDIECHKISNGKDELFETY